MIGRFVFEALPVRVLFGRGTLAALSDEVGALGAKRALVLTTPQRADEGRTLQDILGPLFGGIFPGAAMHTPHDVTERALVALHEADADCVISFGGGSTTGLGKALALRTGINQVCVPTTYAGSEMTPILGETKNGQKVTLQSRDVLPETVIYDVDLTMTLPPALSSTSGMNAIAHAVEALYAKDGNPIISLMAEEGIRALADALPKVVGNPSDPEARSGALYGAWLCGICLGSVGMALHHKLCHTLGGSFNLPHAETHAIILPHAVSYNAPAAPQAMVRIARALGVRDPAQELYDLAKRLGAKLGLRDIGMPRDGIEQAAAQAIKNPYWNPRPVEHAAIRDLILRAWAGSPPLASLRP